MKTALVTLTALALAGCATMGAPAGQRATADLKNAQGQSIGTATFAEQADGTVRVAVRTRGLTPGKHGIHVHAVGRCEPAGFATAGGHHNPLGAKHGIGAPGGPHAGDLPNLEADSTGSARYETTTDRLTLRDGTVSVFDADGSALVIHEKEDDQRTDPAGESGARVACGVIQRGA
jgi:Cu-Zn family superoxide dismutase